MNVYIVEMNSPGGNTVKLSDFCQHKVTPVVIDSEGEKGHLNYPMMVKKGQPLEELTREVKALEGKASDEEI